MLDLPSVTTMIASSVVDHERVSVARRIASPIAVPESHGRLWSILSGLTHRMMDVIHSLSLVNGIIKKGFPANTISPMEDVVFSHTNSRRVFLAWMMRDGEISSASMDLDISRTMSILCSSCIDTLSSLSIYAHDMSSMKNHTIKNLSIQSMIYHTV